MNTVLNELDEMIKKAKKQVSINKELCDPYYKASWQALVGSEMYLQGLQVARQIVAESQQREGGN